MRKGKNELYLQTHKGSIHVASFNWLRHLVPLNRADTQNKCPTYLKCTLGLFHMFIDCFSVKIWILKILSWNANFDGEAYP